MAAHADVFGLVDALGLRLSDLVQNIGRVTDLCKQLSIAHGCARCALVLLVRCSQQAACPQRAAVLTFPYPGVGTRWRGARVCRSLGRGRLLAELVSNCKDALGRLSAASVGVALACGLTPGGSSSSPQSEPQSAPAAAPGSGGRYPRSKPPPPLLRPEDVVDGSVDVAQVASSLQTARTCADEAESRVQLAEQVVERELVVLSEAFHRADAEAQRSGDLRWMQGALASLQDKLHALQCPSWPLPCAHGALAGAAGTHECALGALAGKLVVPPPPVLHPCVPVCCVVCEPADANTASADNLEACASAMSGAVPLRAPRTERVFLQCGGTGGFGRACPVPRVLQAEARGGGLRRV